MRRLLRIRFALTGWALASCFFTAVILVGNIGEHKSPAFALYSNAVHFALWALLLPLVTRCTRSFPLDGPRRSLHVAALLVIIAAIAAPVVIIQWAIVFVTYFPYRSNDQTYWSFLRPNLGRFYPVDVLIGIVLVVALEGVRVLQSLQAERTRAIELERQVAVARLDALRMQLHPHFLFNTLHTIAGLTVEQPQARSMVIALGELLRLTLKDTDRLVRSLAEELKFADLYLGIEKIRLGDRLVINYDLDPEATRAEVPQLLLQPLFENAVRHGAARTTGKCEIRFRAHRDKALLHLMISNDGTVSARASTPSPQGVGLTNTRDRLRLHYEDAFTFQYSDRPQGGVQIDISIPYKVDEGKSMNRSRPALRFEDLGDAEKDPPTGQRTGDQHFLHLMK